MASITLSKILIKDSTGSSALYPRIRINDITSLVSVKVGNDTSYTVTNVATAAGKISNSFLEINKVTAKSTTPSTTAIPTVAVVKEYVSSKVATVGGAGQQAGIKQFIFGNGVSEANGKTSGALTVCATYATTEYDPGAGVVKIADNGQLLTSGGRDVVTANRLHEYYPVIKFQPVDGSSAGVNGVLGTPVASGSWVYTSEIDQATATSTCIRNVADHILYDVITSDLYFYTSSGYNDSAFRKKAFFISGIQVNLTSAVLSGANTVLSKSWTLTNYTSLLFEINSTWTNTSGYELIFTPKENADDFNTLAAKAGMPNGNGGTMYGTVYAENTATGFTTQADAVPTASMVWATHSAVVSAAVSKAESKIVSTVYSGMYLAALPDLMYYEEL